MKRITLLLVLLMMVVPIFAQSDLTEEEVAMLEVLEALVSDLRESGGSYAYTAISTESSTTEVTVGETVSTAVESISSERSAVVIDAGLETENVHGFAEVTYEAVTLEGEELAFVMEAEVRYVDGTLYVYAEYTESMGNVPTLPTDWVVVDDADAFPELSVLNLDGILDADTGTERFNQISENAVRVEYEAFEDGSEAIFAYFDGAGVTAVAMEDDGNPFNELVAAITDEVLSIGIAVTGEGVIESIVTTSNIALADIDLMQFNPNSPEGALLRVTSATSELQEFDLTYTEFTPVEAPEM
jgi:hypothetical protein